MPGRSLAFVTTLVIALALAAPVSAHAAAWTWFAGDSLLNQHGVYGSRGAFAPGNAPGARMSSPGAVWQSGDWLFGGTGYGASGASGQLNDLWQYSSPLQQWRYVSGGTTPNALGVYGTPGVAAPTNVPGSRSNHMACCTGVDPLLPPSQSDRLFVFGGTGYGVGGPPGLLNDLWMFDGTNWAWVAGAPAVNQPGVYGTLGLPAPGNHPGARRDAALWFDPGTHALWLFGGYGYAQDPATSGYLNDMWRWDGTMWTWTGGSSVVNDPGLPLGSMATRAVVANRAEGAVFWPGGWAEAKWVFDSVVRVLFGIGGHSHSGGSGPPRPPREVHGFADLWTFNMTSELWDYGYGIAAGDSCPSHGAPGVPDSTNGPGWGSAGAAWRASDGTLWLYGGVGYDGTCTVPGPLAALWQLNGTDWAFISGLDAGLQGSDHGTLGQMASAVTPGSRYGATAWTDPVDGHMRLFGGQGYDFGLAPGLCSDLWRLDDHATLDVPRPEAASALALGPATPNPAGERAAWVLTLPRPARVTAEVFDAAGRRVARLLDARHEAGRVALGWDLRDCAGRRVKSGAYFLRVRAGGGILRASLAVVR